MVASAISGVGWRDACTGRALARSRFNSPCGAGYRDRRCYAVCTEHLIWLQLSFRTQDPTRALSADRGRSGRSARADMLCGAALWALRTPCIVKSRISGKDADTRHQFWEPALSHGCPSGRSCSSALVATRPVWRPCRLSPSREGFLSAPRQHDLTGTAAALRPQPGGIDPGTVHRRSDKGRPLVRCQLLASEFYENVEA
jgi:hypothetical protein